MSRLQDVSEIADYWDSGLKGEVRRMMEVRVENRIVGES